MTRYAFDSNALQYIDRAGALDALEGILDRRGDQLCVPDSVDNENVLARVGSYDAPFWRSWWVSIKAPFDPAFVQVCAPRVRMSHADTDLVQLSRQGFIVVTNDAELRSCLRRLGLPEPLSAFHFIGLAIREGALTFDEAVQGLRDARPSWVLDPQDLIELRRASS